MAISRLTCFMVLFIAFAVSGCGHSQTSRIALVSFGDLNGKIIPDNPAGPSLQGITTAGAFRLNYYLSDAVREALRDTEYDTLVNVEVTAETGFLVYSNTLVVRGIALNSKKLERPGGPK